MHDAKAVKDAKNTAAVVAAPVGPGQRYNTTEEHLSATQGACVCGPMVAAFPGKALAQRPSPKSFTLKG